ncbi:MAG TPA: sugar phosphate isomerase/epimerase [Anaeromyxobacter sp.]|nr:sugar phosphate isomerase/epimerase [Anaeromyxobacter sp.]
MKLGVFAKTFAGNTPREVLGAARRAGYEAVQYNWACSGLGSLPDRIPEGEAVAVGLAAAGAGLEVVALSTTYNMVHPDLSRRQAGRRAFAASASAAGEAGARLLTVCTGSRDPEDQWRHHPDNRSPGAFQDLCEECEAVLALAEAHDLWVGVEPELGNVVDSARRARELLDALRSERLRIVLDPANLFEVAGPAERRRLVEEAVDLLGSRISLAHAKDRDAAGRVVAAGRGVVDFGHFLATLRRAGFDGPLVTHGLTEAEAPEVALRLRALVQGGEGAG